MVPYVIEQGVADLDDVQERFGYTREQLLKDLNTVFVCGLPGYGPGDLMSVDMDEETVSIDATDYFSRAPRLTPTEGLGLLASGLTVLGMGDDVPALRRAVNKLTKVLVPGAGEVLSIDLDESTDVTALRQAATDTRVVRITYRSLGKEETTQRDIEPWSVFHTMGRWYVIGHCRLVDDRRTFRVDRIRDLEVLDEVFARPDQIPDPLVGYTQSDTDVSCVVDLSPRARWVMEYYPVEVLKETAKTTRVRFWAPDAELGARLLIRLGSDARLVEGEEVATRLRELATTLKTQYL